MEKSKKTNPLWGGRFSQSPNDLALGFSSSIGLDKNLYKEDIDGSLVYAMALKEAKVITPKEYLKIKKGLLYILGQIQSGKFQWQEGLEDVHMNIESALHKKIGSAAKKLHTGRSRNDQVATDLRLYLLKKTELIIKLITKNQKVIISKAKKYSNSIMPGFTHTQAAQPITFGHHLMAWNEMLERDFSRFMDSKDRTSVLPLGSSALSGNSYNLDREKMAKRLGFARTSNNSLDAVSDRDFIIEFLSCASILGTHLSRMNEELILWSSPQFGYIELDDQFCTGSSIMPQKKNPDIAELIRGGSSKVSANLIGMLSLMKGLPLSYNRDMQEDKAFLFNSVDFVASSLEIFHMMIETMNPNLNKMKEDCEIGHITATELADYLVSKGMNFRAAHERVGKIVTLADKENKQIHELSITQLKSKCKIIESDVFKSLVPENAVTIRNSKGGTAPKQVLKQIAIAERILKKR